MRIPAAAVASDVGGADAEMSPREVAVVVEKVADGEKAVVVVKVVFVVAVSAGDLPRAMISSIPKPSLSNRRRRWISRRRTLNFRSWA